MQGDCAEKYVAGFNQCVYVCATGDNCQEDKIYDRKRVRVRERARERGLRNGDANCLWST